MSARVVATGHCHLKRNKDGISNFWHSTASKGIRSRQYRNNTGSQAHTRINEKIRARHRVALSAVTKSTLGSPSLFASNDLTTYKNEVEGPRRIHDIRYQTRGPSAALHFDGPVANEVRLFSLRRSSPAHRPQSWVSREIRATSALPPVLRELTTARRGTHFSYTLHHQHIISTVFPRFPWNGISAHISVPERHPIDMRNRCYMRIANLTRSLFIYSELSRRVASQPTPVSAPSASISSALVVATRSSVLFVLSPVTSHGVLRVSLARSE